MNIHPLLSITFQLIVWGFVGVLLPMPPAISFSEASITVKLVGLAFLAWIEFWVPFEIAIRGKKYS
jgi:hypothetical protein